MKTKTLFDQRLEDLMKVKELVGQGEKIFVGFDNGELIFKLIIIVDIEVERHNETVNSILFIYNEVGTGRSRRYGIRQICHESFVILDGWDYVPHSMHGAALQENAIVYEAGLKT